MTARRLLWPSVLAPLALVLAVVGQPSGSAAQPLGYGETTFADLGWSENATLSLAGSRTAEVRFELPPDARQGETSWYALRLGVRWSGVPSPTIEVSLDAKWNGVPAHTVLVRRPPWAPSFGNGWAEFQTVDLVSGGSRGLAADGRFDFRSSNYPTFASVRPGWNVLSLELSSLGQSDADVTVVVGRSSSILVSNVGPAQLAFDGRGELRDRELLVKVSGRNSGISTPPVRFVVVAHCSDGRRHQGLSAPIGSVGTLRRFEATVRYTLPEPGPLAVQLIGDWDAGQSGAVLVYPVQEAGGVDLLSRPALTALAVAAFVVAWIAFPTAAAALRSARSRSA